MFVAVCSGSRVCTVDSSESASLDTMSRLAANGERDLTRLVVSAKEYILYSEGANLFTDVEVIDGKVFRRVRVVSTQQFDAMSRKDRVWRLWLRMPANASDALWGRFNAVINRKFGPPVD